jgi:secondary thiamine-phosphate synthase enzyme
MMFLYIIMEADLTREIPVRTRKRNELIDITSTIRELIDESGVTEGICHIFVPHTTAAVTINEKADPAVAMDISNTLEKIVPAGWGYGHSEGNSDSHVKSSLVGASEFVIISGGRPVMGTWQAVFFCEFDGPRSRHCVVRISGE